MSRIKTKRQIEKPLKDLLGFARRKIEAMEKNEMEVERAMNKYRAGVSKALYYELSTHMSHLGNRIGLSARSAREFEIADIKAAAADVVNFAMSIHFIADKKDGR